MSAGTTSATARASRVVALVVALLGIAISIYLTIEHYRGSLTLACPETGVVNCLKVTTSKWSVIAGIPVAVLGLAFFAGMTIMLLLPAWRAVLTLRLVGASIGVAMVLYLVYIELFEVDAICLWCTAVHLCTLILFGTVLWNSLGTSPHSARRTGLTARSAAKADEQRYD